MYPNGRHGHLLVLVLVLGRSEVILATDAAARRSRTRRADSPVVPLAA